MNVDRKVVAALEALVAWVEGRFDRLEQQRAGGGVPNEEQRAFTVKEFAERLQVSEHTVGRAISHGLIHAVNIGSRLTIPASEFSRLMREGIPSIPPGYKAKDAANGASRQKRARRRRK